MGLLKGLEIKRMEEEKKQLQEFDKRNKALWDVSQTRLRVKRDHSLSVIPA